MSNTLHDLLQSKTDNLAAPEVHLDVVLAEGGRRVRRRRIALATGGCAVAAAASLLALQVGLPGTGLGRQTVPEAPLAAAFAANQPTYSIGNTIHIDGEKFTVQHDLALFVQTAEGVVYADRNGAVWASDGVEEQRLGTMDWANGRLVADGSLVAWINRPEGAEAKLVVLDQATGETQEHAVELAASRTEGGEFEDVVAMDDTTVYWLDQRGYMAWNITADATRALPGVEGKTVDFRDAEAGRFAWLESTLDGEVSGVFVGKAIGRGVELTPSEPDPGYIGQTYLSPDGRIVTGEISDGVPAIFNATTGQQLPLDSGDYPFLVLYRWIDNDHVAAIGIDGDTEGSDESTWVFDLLTCSVSEGACRVVEPAFTKVADGFNIPVGEAMEE